MDICVIAGSAEMYSIAGISMGADVKEPVQATVKAI